jgi:hypothetical protein
MERNEFKDFGVQRPQGNSNAQQDQQQKAVSLITVNPAPNASPPSAPSDTYLIVKR